MRKRCRRKVYALTNPIAMAISGAAITDTASLNQLRMRELSALESFRTGKATRTEWMDLADLLNIAQTMGQMGIGPEVLPVCARAQDALAAAHARFKAGKGLGFDGPGMEAMRALAEYHDLQRQSVSRGEYEKAIRKTVDKIRGASPAVKVLI
jgi:hypothetical protein